MTQCGDALAHSQEGVLHCASSDRFAGLVGNAASESGPEHEEVAESAFGVGDVTQARVLAEIGAEGGPVLEDADPALASFGDKSGVRGLQRSAEISSEAISGRRACCFQGVCNG